MEDYFDNLFNSLHTFDWYQNVQNTLDLPDADILDEIRKASDFFNLNVPIEVREDWTTGVLTGLPFTENDDILVFNRQQLADLGITDKEAFGLVMTHEGAHRALQNKHLGFNSQQEELCCDYLSGVRAGLNHIDESKMCASLADTMESSTHPGGTARIQAIEMGVDFAQRFMEVHKTPPTLSECIDEFEKSGLFTKQINLSPEDGLKAYTQGDIEWLEHQVRITSGSEQAHWYNELKWAKSHISGFVSTYTPEEINAMKEKVAKLEYERNCIKSDVDLYKSRMSLKADSFNVSKYNECVDKLNNVESKLKDARNKLNNAL